MWCVMHYHYMSEQTDNICEMYVYLACSKHILYIYYYQ